MDAHRLKLPGAPERTPRPKMSATEVKLFGKWKLRLHIILQHIICISFKHQHHVMTWDVFFFFESFSKGMTHSGKEHHSTVSKWHFADEIWKTACQMRIDETP